MNRLTHQSFLELCLWILIQVTRAVLPVEERVFPRLTLHANHHQTIATVTVKKLQFKMVCKGDTGNVPQPLPLSTFYCHYKGQPTLAGTLS